MSENDPQTSTQDFLDQLLQSGRELFEQGREMASKGVEYAQEGVEEATDQIGETIGEYVEIPPPGPEREALMKKIGSTAAVGGLLALLVGTKSGRKILGPILKIGSVAALGALGFKAYEKWQQQQGNPTDGQSIAHLEGPEAKQRSLAILRAMICAAKADGSISREEEQVVADHITTADLESESAKTLMQEMSNPSSASDIAALSNSAAMGVDLYLSSLAVSGLDSEANKKYLSDLAAQLNLAPGLVEEIHGQAGMPTTS